MRRPHWWPAVIGRSLPTAAGRRRWMPRPRFAARETNFRRFACGALKRPAAQTFIAPLAAYGRDACGGKGGSSEDLGVFGRMLAQLRGSVLPDAIGLVHRRRGSRRETSPADAAAWVAQRTGDLFDHRRPAAVRAGFQQATAALAQRPLDRAERRNLRRTRAE